MKDETFTSGATGMESLIYSPAAHEDDCRVILYLHGSGGFGTGIEGLYEYPDFPSLLRDGMQLTSTVLIPSCHAGEHWQALMISDFLDDFEKAHGRSSIRYDVLGYSRGGIGAFNFAAVYPKRVRSIAVVSTRPVLDMAPRIAGIPILICHGLSDR
jgi:poly(3-hydroxybutyrate) depolymerase